MVSFTDHGSGPAVVFLHGVGSGKEGWEAQIEPVVGAGWRFIAIDAPGFGETTASIRDGFADHVSGVLEVLDKHKIDRCVLCGHSLGGMTAQEFYVAYPERVSGLILSATSPAFGRADGDFQKKFLRDRFEPFEQGMSMPEFAQSFAPKLAGPDVSQASVANIVDVMSRVSIDAYRKAMMAITTFDQRANLEKISVPTLLIAGEMDSNSPSPDDGKNG